MNDLKQYAIARYKTTERNRLINKQSHEAKLIEQALELVWESAREELQDYITFKEFSATTHVKIDQEYHSAIDHVVIYVFTLKNASPIKVHTANTQLGGSLNGIFEVATYYDEMYGSIWAKQFNHFVEALGCAYEMYPLIRQNMQSHETIVNSFK